MSAFKLVNIKYYDKMDTDFSIDEVIGNILGSKGKRIDIIINRISSC